MRHLRTGQVIGRVLKHATAPVVRPLLRSVGASRPPRVRTRFTDPEPELVAHVDRELVRSKRRIGSFGGSDRALAAFERMYGYGIPARTESPTAEPPCLEPYPAAVRARKLALAARLGVEIPPAELARCARAVLLQLETHLAGNHLLEDGYGLVCAGVVCVGAEADLWYAAGARILDVEVAEQFLSDGGHYERSATYHGWVVTGLLELLALHRATGRPFPQAWADALDRALDFVDRIEAPDGTWPMFNDASLDFCPRPTELRELARGLGVVRQPRAKLALDVLPDTGWVVARNGHAVVIADVGPIGPSYIPGHAHADMLGFELWVEGTRVVVDTGVAAYAEGPLRSFSRGTLAHNTISVDCTDSAEVWSSFRVGRRGEGRLRSWTALPVPTWTAEHDGYAHLDGGPVHRRRWILESDRLTIEDSIEGAGEHVVLASLHLDREAARDLAVEVEGDAVSDSMAGAWFPEHGQRRPAVVYSGGGLRQLPCRLTTRLDWQSTLRSSC